MPVSAGQAPGDFWTRGCWPFANEFPKNQNACLVSPALHFCPVTGGEQGAGADLVNLVGLPWLHVNHYVCSLMRLLGRLSQWDTVDTCPRGARAEAVGVYVLLGVVCSRLRLSGFVYLVLLVPVPVLHRM